MYVGALFSAILAIAIFKDYRDNGAELIVVSKPISRYKIILTKFLVYMFVSLIFVLFLALISLSTFSFGSVSGKDVGSLVFSIIISNLVFIIAFGFLSTIVSIFFSKVWTILANILVVIVLNIYSTITVIVVKSPGDIANNEGSVIITSQYLSKNGEVKSMGALTPQFKQDEHGFSLDASFDNEVEQWNRYVNSSSANLATKFDFIHQFALMSNMLTLQEKMNDKASNYFGSSRFFNYKINKSITNLEREDQPLYYVKLPILTQSSAVFDSNDVNKIMIAISTGDIATLNSYLERAMNFFMTMLTDESVVYIGNSNTSIISSLFSVNKTTNNDQLVIASGIDGNTGSRNNRIYYSKDMLQTNEQEEKIFKKIICDLDNEDNYDKFVGSSTSTTSPNIIVANNVYGGKNYSGGSSNDLPMRLVGFNNDVDGWSLSNTLSAFSNLIDVPTLTNRGMLRNF
jgi:ABC-type transport system involved in multi-copper enzyme maturation permease subunit